jgi:hypothetical protein
VHVSSQTFQFFSEADVISGGESVELRLRPFDANSLASNARIPWTLEMLALVPFCLNSEFCHVTQNSAMRARVNQGPNKEFYTISKMALKILTRQTIRLA